MKDRHGEHIFCELPDGTICSLPAWMFRSDCMHFPIGSPRIFVEALAALRDLIGALRAPTGGAMATLNQPPKEGVDEATSYANEHAVQPAAARRAGGSTARQQAEGTQHGPIKGWFVFGSVQASESIRGPCTRFGAGSVG
jgi:hypothetical protein